MMMIMIKIQGKGTACTPDQYIASKIILQNMLIFIKIIVNLEFKSYNLIWQLISLVNRSKSS